MNFMPKPNKNSSKKWWISLSAKQTRNRSFCSALVREVMPVLIPMLICSSSKASHFLSNAVGAEEAGRLWLALANIDVSKDLLLYSRDEVEARKDSLNHVVGRAFREGKVLHVKN